MRFEYPSAFTRASEWAPTDTGLVITFRDLPEAVTQAESDLEAMGAAEECLTTVIEARLRAAAPVPHPSVPLPGEQLVRLSGTLAVKVALRDAVDGSGLSDAELARRLHVEEKEVRRMLDPRHPTRLAQMEAALRALDKRLQLEVHAEAGV